MAEPLKEMFNRVYFDRLAKELEAVHPPLKRTAFLKAVQHGNEVRELNARMRHAAITLRSHLPIDYRKAVQVLKDLAPRMPKGYTALLYPDFVGLHGLDEPAFSLEALRYFTGFGSSEFAVREFFRRDDRFVGHASISNDRDIFAGANDVALTQRNAIGLCGNRCTHTK